jgi:hypothetical protein
MSLFLCFAEAAFRAAMSSLFQLSNLFQPSSLFQPVCHAGVIQASAAAA